MALVPRQLLSQLGFRTKKIYFMGLGNQSRKLKSKLNLTLLKLGATGEIGGTGDVTRSQSLVCNL